MASTKQSPVITISSLGRITSPELATLLLDGNSASKVAVIDVRDSDHLGGHIKGSSWIPTDQLDMRIPELMRLHKDKDRVVFHCMLSQQRGPASALKFARALQTAAEKASVEDGQRRDNEGRPQVYVLEGGFGMWQARYGTDARLTESYMKDLWE